MIDSRMLVIYKTLRARGVVAHDALRRARKLHKTMLNMFAVYHI